jgi:hydroxypyruvate reductase
VSPEPGAREALASVYRTALEAVEPGRCIDAALRRDASGCTIAGRPIAAGARVFVLGAGKAAAAMAAAAEATLGDALVEGLVLVPDGFERPLERCVLRSARHPLPDARGEAATREILAWLSRLEPDDVLLVLLSGGGSSLLCAAAEGLSLTDVAAAAGVLLLAGASIDELNAVRKHLSLATGGRLAAAARAERVEVLVISDVTSNRLDVIASGPFAPDPTRYADALAVLGRRDPGRRIPSAVRVHLEAGARGERDETPDRGDPVFDRVRHTLVASNEVAVHAACEAAVARGWRAVPLPRALSGEASAAAEKLVALAHACAAREPLCLVAGGETVVTVRGKGVGGRSQELALAAALAIEGRSDIALLAAGSDGADGPTDAAGAFVDGESVARGRAAGVAAAACLADNDSHGFFDREGGLLRTGPTGTNVADLVLVLRDADR